MFLRNHDELTLEMVTDEERDHMYRVYARDPRARLNLGIRRRLAPLLGNDRTKIELMNILLFSLPGAPIIYYGDEIGMGDNYYLGDRDGVRTPMQWSADRNAGFSRTGPHQLYLPVIIDPEYHFEALNVETQNKNSSSLLWWMKRLISVRKNYACLSRGDMEFLFPDNPRVLAFTRSYEEQTILIVSNLSRFHQVVELDLGSYSTCVPKEVFSLNRFPHIGEEPYRLTLGPYGYLWLTLEREQEPVRLREPGEVAELNVQGHWRQVLRGEARKKFERQILPVFLESCTWFPGKNGRLKRLRIEEELRLSAREDAPTLLLLEAEYSEDPQEHYLLPLDFAPQEQALEVMEHFKSAMICRLTVDGTWGLLYDGGYSEMVRCAIFDLLRRRRKLRGLHGDLVVLTGRKTRTLLHEERFDLASRVLSETREYSNTSIVFENRYFLKMYRRFEDSSGPDAEVARFLSEEAGFRGIPRYLGSVEYHKQGKEPLALCLLQEFVPNQGEAWSLAQSVLSRYYETMLMENGDASSRETIGSLFIELTERLGQCTAAMHRALASFPKNPLYAPEPFSKLYQRSLYQSLRSRVLRALSRLEKRIPGLSDPLRDELLPVLSAKDRILAALNLVRERTISGKKTRIHGDFNLSQVLFTGNDFLIIDYEGEQGLAASAKVLKYSPLRDVADMILSFHVAAHHALAQHTSIHPEDLQRLEPYAAQWQRSVSRHFISAYREAMAGSALLPEGEAEQDVLLRAFLLDKAINAVLLEIEGHPQQALIPLRSIQSLLEESCFESD